MVHPQREVLGMAASRHVNVEIRGDASHLRRELKRTQRAIRGPLFAVAVLGGILGALIVIAIARLIGA
jgi:hypothetical protein